MCTNYPEIDALLIKPLQYPQRVTIGSDLNSLKKAVEGPIEDVYPWEDNACILCNEEGKINGLTPNRALYDDSGELVDIIAGSFLIVGLSEESFQSLTKQQMEHYEDLFYSPQVFMRFGQHIAAIPCEAEEPSHKVPGHTSKIRDDDAR
ncbi:MAG: DUF3846 domain-containing protein [Bulleidia sp.]|nr:DUF3846 domain-containing protein [Bulleidia sp.]